MIVIDPKNKTVTERDAPEGAPFRDILGPVFGQVARPTPADILVAGGEERAKAAAPGFWVESDLGLDLYVIGTAVICGVAGGVPTGTSLSAELVAPKIVWDTDVSESLSYDLKAARAFLEEYGMMDLVTEGCGSLEQAVEEFGDRVQRDLDHLDGGGTVAALMDAFFYFHHDPERPGCAYGFTETAPAGEFEDDRVPRAHFAGGQLATYAYAKSSGSDLETVVVHYKDMKDAAEKTGWDR